MRTHPGARTNPKNPALTSFHYRRYCHPPEWIPPFCCGGCQHCCWRIWFRRNPEISLIPTCRCLHAVFTWTMHVSFCWSMWGARQGTCGVGRATETCRCRCLLPYRLNHSLLSMRCIHLWFYLPAYAYLVSAFEWFWCSAHPPGLYKCLIDSVLDLSASSQMSRTPIASVLH